MNVSPESSAVLDEDALHRPRRPPAPALGARPRLLSTIDALPGPSESSHGGERNGRRRRAVGAHADRGTRDSRTAAGPVRALNHVVPVGARVRRAEPLEVAIGLGVEKTAIAPPPVPARRAAPREPSTRAHPRCRPRSPSHAGDLPVRRGRRSSEARRSRAAAKEAASAAQRGCRRRSLPGSRSLRSNRRNSRAASRSRRTRRRSASRAASSTSRQSQASSGPVPRAKWPACAGRAQRRPGPRRLRRRPRRQPPPAPAKRAAC